MEKEHPLKKGAFCIREILRKPKLENGFSEFTLPKAEIAITVIINAD